MLVSLWRRTKTFALLHSERHGLARYVDNDFPLTFTFIHEEGGADRAYTVACHEVHAGVRDAALGDQQGRDRFFGKQ